jgi:MFS family permease
MPPMQEKDVLRLKTRNNYAQQMTRRVPKTFLGTKQQSTQGSYPEYIDVMEDDDAELALRPLYKRKPTSLSNIDNVDEGAATIDPAARRLRTFIFICTFCSSVTQTMPVVILPLIASQHSVHHGGTGAAAFVAAVASVSTIGGAVGQFVNGFVCQHFGGQRSGSMYMLGMALTALLISTATSHMQVLCFCMEYFAAIQWTSCSTVMSNHFADDPKAFAAGITAMSLGSTLGILTAKAIGMALLQTLHWKQVSQLAAIVAVLGALVMELLVKEYPSQASPPPPRPAFSIQRIIKGTKAVLGSGLFWILGLAHATSSLASTSDRVLGSFFREVTRLPRKFRSVLNGCASMWMGCDYDENMICNHSDAIVSPPPLRPAGSVCGGLTASVTVGFIYGLVSSSSFYTKDKQDKKTMLERRYGTAVLSALTLAMCARLGGSPVSMSLIILASGAMASSLSFQFYQIPNMVASVYGENQAVCLSFMDGVGYTLAAPTWALVGYIVSTNGLGWTAAWVLLATLFAIGGAVTVHHLPSIWEQQEGCKLPRANAS